MKIAYDAMGRITHIENKDMSYDYAYDVAGRLVSSTDAQGRAIEYTYDASGRKTSMKTFEGITTNYAYDAAGRLASIKQSAYNVADSDHSNVSEQIFTYSYDALGRRIALNYPNNINASYAYDKLGRLTGLAYKTKSNEDVAGYAYTHDNVGNRLTKTERRGKGLGSESNDQSIKYDYAYDALNRVAAETRPMGQATEYAYSAIGLIKTIKDAEGRVTVYAYDTIGVC